MEVDSVQEPRAGMVFVRMCCYYCLCKIQERHW